MLRQKTLLVKFPIYILDVFLTIGAFLLAYWLRNTYLLGEYGHLYALKHYLWLLLIVIPVWTILFYYFALYESITKRPFWWDIWKVFKPVFWGTLLLIFLVFVFKLHYISRFFIFFFAAINVVLLAAEKAVLRYMVLTGQRGEFDHRNALVVGTHKAAREIAGLIEAHRHWGLKLLGFIAEDSSGEAGKIRGYNVLGTIEDIPRILKDRVVDEVIFAVSKKMLEECDELFLLCEELGISTRIVVNFFPYQKAKLHLENLYGVPTLTFTTTPYNEFLLLVKRCFDIVLAFLMLLFLSPLMLFVALLIRVTSAGPVIFKQKRVGLNGRIFDFYKFRSMVQDAERMKKKLEHLNETDGPAFKIKNDPRLTPIGKVIRKTSIDELPQLINVLKGEMSIVGPRPPIPHEVQKYDRWQRRRLSMRPGLTCLWQISGRSNLDFNRWMELDLEYIDNWSLGLDLKIFIKTIPAVLLGRGAA